MSRALVLNATYEPLCVVPTRRALVLVIQAKAELLAATGRVFHAARVTLDEPSVVRLPATGTAASTAARKPKTSTTYFRDLKVALTPGTTS